MRFHTQIEGEKNDNGNKKNDDDDDNGNDDDDDEQASNIILEWVKHFFFPYAFIMQQLLRLWF